MNWSDGANFYLLKSVSNYGKDWALVSSGLSVIAATFLKHERLRDFSAKSCSLQYKYLIASTREADVRYNYLNEEHLLPIAIARYSALRREQIKRRRDFLATTIATEKENNRKLLAGRFEEISPETLLVYRKRLRAFGLQDIIADRLGLEPLPPSNNAEEDSLIRRSLRYADHADNGLCHATATPSGGLWIPVESVDSLKGFFNENNWAPVPIEEVDADVEDEETEEEDNEEDYEDMQEEADEAEKDMASVFPPKKTEVISSSFNDPQTPLSNINAHTAKLRRPSSSSSTSIASASGTKRPPGASVTLPPSKRTSPQPSSPPPLPQQGENPPHSLPLSHRTSRPSTSVGGGGVRRGSIKIEQPHTPTTTSRKSRYHRSQHLAVDSPTDPSPSSQMAPRRRWRRVFNSALNSASNTRHAHIFLNPVTDDIAPGYSGMILRPIDLSSLRHRIESRMDLLTGSSGAGTAAAVLSEVEQQALVIQTAKEMLHDLLLMFANARMYNNREHGVHKVAGEMCTEVLAELRPLWALLEEEIPNFPPLPGNPVVSGLRRRNLSTAAPTPVVPESSIHSPPSSSCANAEVPFFPQCFAARETNGDHFSCPCMASRVKSCPSDDVIERERLGKVIDVCDQAVWCLSSCKNNHGIEQLLSDSLDAFWQSDGPQPHTVTMVFPRKTVISEICLYNDYKVDESYTPNRISIRVGNHVGDLIELTEVELHEPMGWTSLPLKWPNGAPVSLFTMQLCVLANHQNGRDTHLRGIRLFSPARHTGLEVHPSLFTKPEGRMFATIR